MKLDDINIAILRDLQDGRKSYSQVAQDIGVAENTVRARVNKLMEDGVLSIKGLTNPQMLPEMQIVFMGIKLKTLNLEEKAKEILKLKGVISVVVVTGRYDLIAQVATESDNGNSLLNFFKNELNKIDDLLDIETFVVYQAHNYQVPYTL